MISEELQCIGGMKVSDWGHREDLPIARKRVEKGMLEKINRAFFAAVSIV